MKKLDIAQIKRDVVTACRILDNENVMDELGHFSVRIPDTNHILINGRVSPGKANINDIITVDLDGRKVDGILEPAGETPLHLSIYNKRADVFAIAHTHSPMVIVLSTLGIRLKPLHNTGAVAIGLSKEVPIYEKYGLISSGKLGDEVADMLGNSHSIMLKGHGNVVVSSSIKECCVTAIWIEKAAYIQYQAMTIGVPDALSQEVIDGLAKEFAGGQAFNRAWDYFVWRAKRRGRIN